MQKQKKSPAFQPGATVQWKWMGRAVTGKIKRVYKRPVSKTFRGATYKRNGSQEKPAYLIKSAAGSEILKSHTELTRKD